jgi:Flp pilus assembly protein TadD
MRFLVKVSLPVEAGNESAKKDGLKVIQRILDQQKPEAAYFLAEDGKRTGFLIMNVEDASQIPAIAENLGEAQDQVRWALRTDSDSAEAHNLLGNIYLNRHELDDARAEFKETLRLDPDFKASRAALDRL